MKYREAVTKSKQNTIILAQTRRVLKKAHRRVSDITILINDMEESIPALEAKLIRMKEQLPKLKKEQSGLQLQIKRQRDSLVKQEDRAEKAAKRVKIIKQLRELNMEINDGGK